MQEKGIAAYIVPTSDCHISEYLGDYFKTREFMSGFTGSAGTLVIKSEKAGLWTDGRYFIQAEEQLKGTGITLFKSGEEGVPSISQYLSGELAVNSVIAADGKTVQAAWVSELMGNVGARGIVFDGSCDLVGEIWEDRPPISDKPAYLLDEKYTGKSSRDKIAQLREQMKKTSADIHILASLDDIAWLFNIRGDDIRYTPVVLAYAVITYDKSILFAEEKKFSQQDRKKLEADGIEIKNYNAVYEYINQLPESNAVLLSGKKVNYCLYNGVKSRFKIIDKENPTVLLKSVKNAVEIDCIRKAHHSDGAAVTRLMYKLKNKKLAEPVTEMSVSQEVNELRAKNSDNRGPSFETITGYGPHSAVIHYSPSEQSNFEIKGDGLLLIDSGGQYLGGTTDITRTIAIGEITLEQKRHYTLVLKGLLALSALRFPHGAKGFNLDAVARAPIWKELLDYNHGTGHGVGSFLNVHEGPCSIMWKSNSGQDIPAIMPGMVLSAEPGIYITGSHGVRLENLLLCVEAPKSEFGNFLEFETLTFAPFDLDAVDVSLLNCEERKMLNDYHKKVYEKLCNELDNDEKIWLEKATKPI